MANYIVRRLLMLVPVLFFVSLIAFVLIFMLPGDAALAQLGDQVANDPVRLEAFRRELGLDQPVAVRYLRWLGRTLQGDLGTSVRSKEPVLVAITNRLLPSVELGLVALVMALVVAVPIAILSALRPGSWLDFFGTLLAVAGMAVPGFWLGILLIYTFAVWLRWLPPSGYIPFAEDPVANLRGMLLPGITVSTWITIPILRQLRASLIETLQSDYIRAARAKGLPWFKVVVKHGLRNALIPTLTVLGGIIGHLYSGTVIGETIFSIPGTGRLVTDSILYRDFPVTQGIVLLASLSVLLANLFTDLLYAYVDPRIRYT